jgi:hypothetical protein
MSDKIRVTVASYGDGRNLMIGNGISSGCLTSQRRSIRTIFSLRSSHFMF